MIIGLVGICLGVLMAGSRVPRTRWVPFASGALLLVVTVVFLLQSRGSYVDGLLLFLGTFIASALYGGLLWQRQKLEPGVGYWGWVWRDVTNQKYLRGLYEESRRTDFLDDAASENAR